MWSKICVCDVPQRRKYIEMKKEQFLYDAKLKLKKIRKFVNCNGYQCSLCGKVVKNIKIHLFFVHNKAKSDRNFQRAYEESCLNNSISSSIISCKKTMVSTVAGKRAAVMGVVHQSMAII